MRTGATRTSLRLKGPGCIESPSEVTGRTKPLPTRVGKRRRPGWVDVTGVGCCVVGGIGVYHSVCHKRRESGHRRAEAAGEGLQVPLPEPRRRGR
jgi:hypothetical protein